VRRPLKWAGIALLLLLIAAAWFAVLLVDSNDSYDPRPVGALEVILVVLAVAALVAGLLAEFGSRSARCRPRREAARRASRALLAAVIVAAWSVVLITYTGYLEPLPWEAGALGVVLLLAVSVGAGLVGGWHWWTLLILPAATVGFLYVSEDLFYSGSEFDQYDAAVGRGLLLLPVAIGIGALASRWIRKGLVVGLAVMALPLVGIAWAGERHVRPVDHRPADRLLIDVPSNPERPAYRGLAIADTKAQMLELFGRPDRARGIDYKFGADTVKLSGSYAGVFNERGGATWNGVEYIVIRDSRAETAVGVGIGDNLAVFKRRYPGQWCGLLYRRVGCEISLGYAYVDFDGDPIKSITLVASGTKGRG
jgi:hypothetical protein